MYSRENIISQAYQFSNSILTDILLSILATSLAYMLPVLKHAEFIKCRSVVSGARNQKLSK